MDLSIILVNWNSYQVTREAVRSILDQINNVTFEILIIDNGTTLDKGPELLAEEFPELNILRNKDNLGFSKANNQGIRIAQGRYVVLLNNDTIQTGNALGKSVAYLDEHTDIGALGILHRNQDDTQSPQVSYYRFPEPWKEVAGLLGLIRDTEKSDAGSYIWDREGDVDWVCGSYLFMRRECLTQVGELDERFFIFDEDVDWCLRAHKENWKVRYWPGTEMIHIGSAARPHMKDKTFVHFRSHLSYFAKNHSKASAISYYLAMGVRLLGACMITFFRCLIGKTTFSELKLKCRRFVQFLFIQSGRQGGGSPPYGY